jgi:hypothetical protein
VDRRAAVVVALAALAGCNTASSDEAKAFIGTWQISAGQDTADCGAGPQAPTPVMGSVIITSGASSGDVDVRDTNHGMCVWTLRAGASSATFRSGSECKATTDTSDATVVPIDYELTMVAADMATVTSTFNWTILGEMCRHVQDQTIVK